MSPSKWGPPTWTLFHTLACKIKEEHFKQISPALFSFIKQICYNLPCPDCTQHAAAFLTNINIPKIIASKQSLQNFLHFFHNSVNKRKNKPNFEEDRLVNYNNVNLISAFNNFAVVYNTKGNMKLLADSFHRKQLMQNFTNWFRVNAQYFDR